MKLKKLELENLRSYKRASIEFPEGSLLLEGDVGSGKSTLLYAIEFALFGLGDLKSSFLLRNGADHGSVKLEFEVNGRDYAVERTLERRKERAGQGTAAIEHDGVRTEYSPEEMKAAVLNILGFKESPSPKATSWIYRYAVFTPQEEMKAILALKDEERLQTLRKAFGVEEYKTANDNAGIAAKALREEERFLEGKTADLEALKEERQGFEQEVVERRTALEKAVEETVAALKALEEARRKARELAEEKSEADKLSAELPMLERRQKDCAKRAEEAVREGEAKEKRLAETRVLMKKLCARECGDRQAAENELKSLRERLSENEETIGGLKSRKKSFEELESRGVCPTCGKETKGSFADKVRALDEEIKNKTTENTELAVRTANKEKTLDEIRQAHAERQQLEDAQKRGKQLEEEIGFLNKKRADATAEGQAVVEELSEKRARWAALEGITQKIAELEREAAEKEKAHAEKARTQASVEARLDEARKRLAEAGEKMRAKEEQRKRMLRVKEKRCWLQEKFQPVLGEMEEHVLNKTNDDFNAAFQQFFSILLESQDIAVEASESFAPVVEQNGYEQDYKSLSGGEKSALALAYRLALNEVVRTTSTAMKENLLILDEPTDGFSKEQLARMRDVLDEIECEQVILVSHERELEAFVDKVVRIEKKDGESSIAQG